jgi:hypothetical protein
MSLSSLPSAFGGGDYLVGAPAVAGRPRYRFIARHVIGTRMSGDVKASLHFAEVHPARGDIDGAEVLIYAAVFLGR